MNTEVQELYIKAANGNKEALAFLVAWSVFIHRIDDIVDKEITKPEDIIKSFVFAAELFSCNFYLQNRLILLPVIYLIANDYADSENMCRSDIEWKRKLADQLRFCGNTMVKTVACICGNYDLMRSISEPLWTDSNKAHHDGDGKAI